MNKKTSILLIVILFITGCMAPVTQGVADTVVVNVTTPPKPVASSTVTSQVPPTETTAPTETLEPTASPQPTPANIEDVVEFEMRGSFDFFWEQANTDPGSPGYGLIRDRYPGAEGIASIASVGFGLTAYLIGIEKGYITEEQGYARVDQTLDTLLALNRVEGFYYHFLNMETAERAWGSEVSSIDTAILMMGVLSVGEYFGGEIQAKAMEILNGVNWQWFVDPSRNMFYMAYRPEKGKGFEGHWDFYAEQLMLYVLAAGSSTYPVDEGPYYAFTRHFASYGDGEPFIHSWFGSLFTYQFSHAWIDFREYTDKEGVNWFDNSVEASLAHYNYAVKMDKKYETLGPNAWGLTASDGPDGYNGLYGAPPSGFDNKQNKVDDTVPPAGAIGSIIFLPDEARQAMIYYYSFDRLKSRYGFVDAFNLTKDWYATDVIGIDKGISLLMLANDERGFVHNLMMKSEYLLAGLDRLQITRNK